MHFLTGKPLPRRTFVQSMGATVALPFLDAMVPGRVAARAACGARSHAPRRDRDGARRGRVQRARRQDEHVVTGGSGPRTSTSARRRSARSSRIADYLTIISNTDVRDGRADVAEGDRRRPLPVERRVPHAGAPEADRRLRRSVSARRSIRCTRSGSARRRRFRRCSSASRTSIRPAAAPTATPACTRTPSAGRRRPSRCRSFAIRAWRSRSCSASAGRRRSARPGGALAAASSTWSRAR